MRVRPRLLFFFLFLVSSAAAACGGKVVLDTSSSGSSGVGVGGTGGAAATSSSGTPGTSVSVTSSSNVVSSSSGGGECVDPSTDCPSPGTTCVTAGCVGGMCVFDAAQEGTPCFDDGGKVCDGNGNCVQCNAPSDCPASSTACVVTGCAMNVCDGVTAPAGTACTDDGGKVCDGNGDCVQCDAGGAACCIQTCESENVTAYETFVGYELKACGCQGGAPCESVCTGACADPSTLTAGSPCGACLTAQTLDEMSSSCTTNAGITCISDPKCSAFVSCGLGCP